MSLDAGADAAPAAMTEAGTRKAFEVPAAPQGVRTRLTDADVATVVRAVTAVA